MPTPTTTISHQPSQTKLNNATSDYTTRQHTKLHLTNHSITLSHTILYIPHQTLNIPRHAHLGTSNYTNPNHTKLNHAIPYKTVPQHTKLNPTNHTQRSQTKANHMKHQTTQPLQHYTTPSHARLHHTRICHATKGDFELESRPSIAGNCIDKLVLQGCMENQLSMGFVK